MPESAPIVRRKTSKVEAESSKNEESLELSADETVTAESPEAAAAEAGPQGGRPRGRRKKSDLKRRAIIEAAARVFKNKGYAEATLSEIGRKAGTFAGSIYYHFSSKEELVEEVLNMGTTDVSEVVAQVVQALPPNISHRAKIRAAYKAHLNQMLLKDDFIVAYWRIINQVPAEVRSRHLRKPREYGAYWKKLIDDAVDAGEIRPEVHRTLFRMVLIGTTIYALDWYNPRGGLDPDDIADSVLDMLFDGVGRDPVEAAPVRTAPPSADSGKKPRQKRAL